jgi:hypothetical protein
MRRTRVMRHKVLAPVVLILFVMGMLSTAFAWTNNEHFCNRTGQVVNDIHKILKGQWRVPGMSVTTFPFTNVDVYHDGEEMVTHMTWWGNDVPDGGWAHVCFSAFDAAGVSPNRGMFKRAYMTRDGVFVDDLGPVPAVEAQVDPGVLHLKIGNFQLLTDSLVPAPPVWVELDAIFVDACLPMDSLTFEILYDPDSPLPWEPLATRLLHEHGVWYEWDVGFAGNPSGGVFRMTLYYDGDPSSVIHEFTQFTLRPGGEPSTVEPTPWGRIKMLFR